jgi:transposase-like protein
MPETVLSDGVTPGGMGKRRTPERFQEISFRAMIWWMLHGYGRAYTGIARDAGVSSTLVRNWCRWYARRITRRMVEAGENKRDPCVRRLLEAGAIRPAPPGEPPEALISALMAADLP